MMATALRLVFAAALAMAPGVSSAAHVLEAEQNCAQLAHQPLCRLRHLDCRSLPSLGKFAHAYAALT